MSAKIDETRPFVPVRIAVLTVSDTRTLEDDKSGNVLVERLQAAGHRLAGRDIVKDDFDVIVARLRAWIADTDVDVVIATGGTGVTGRDVSPEAFQSVYEKEIAGFADAVVVGSAIVQRIESTLVDGRAGSGTVAGVETLVRELAGGVRNGRGPETGGAGG